MKSINRIHSFFLTGNKRTIKAKKNVVLMLFLKGASIVVSFLYVPLLINTLNSFNYGIWLTVTSIVGWINLLDLGLGNGLRNKLAESLAIGNKKEAKTYVSTAYISITVFSCILALVFLLINPHITWSFVLNAPEHMENELKHLVAIVFLAFCFNLVLRLTTSVLKGFQLPAFAATISFLGQVLSFILVFLLVTFSGRDSLIELGVIIAFSPVIVFVVFSFFLFRLKLKEISPSLNSFSLTHIKSILGLGLKFFGLQIITIIYYQTSNIILAHNVGPEGVTEYNIAYKYIGIVSMIFTIILTPIWSATTDAFNKNDWAWIKNSVKWLNIILIGLSFAGFLLLIFSGIFYNLWLGDKVEPNMVVLLFALLYFTTKMCYGNYNYILNGMGKVKLQLIITSTMAFCYLPLAHYLSFTYGVKGVFFALIFVLLINTAFAIIQYKLIACGKATGIWNK